MTGRSDRWAAAAGFCRDCEAPVGDGEGRCPDCGSPRLVRDDELFELAIAHVDFDAFFASIEKRDDAALRDRPVIVGGGRRGVVAAACYLARSYGVHSAMPMHRAMRLCPQAARIRPDKEKYAAEGRRARAIMERFTPLVEAVSIDEAFLDLSGTERMHGAPPAVVLARLARAVEEEMGLTISVGLSFNKFLAKMASDLDKPRGFAVIGKAGAIPFLDTLKVEDLWGIGPAAARKLARHSIRTVAQLRARDRGWLVAHFGKLGAHMHDLARGHDPRAVNPHHETKSISAEITFEKDMTRIGELEEALWKLCRRVMKQALAKHLAGYTITVKVRHADFTTRTASTRLGEATLLAGRIFRAARPLLRRLHGGPCRLVGVGISNLEAADENTLSASLDERASRAARAELVAERLRRKFGEEAIDLGSGYKNRDGDK